MSSEKIDTKVVSSSNSEQVLKYCLQLNSPEKVNKNQDKINVLVILSLRKKQFSMSKKNIRDLKMCCSKRSKIVKFPSFENYYQEDIYLWMNSTS